jgi:hypothetical protein
MYIPFSDLENKLVNDGFNRCGLIDDVLLSTTDWQARYLEVKWLFTHSQRARIFRKLVEPKTPHLDFSLATLTQTDPPRPNSSTLVEAPLNSQTKISTLRGYSLISKSCNLGKIDDLLLNSTNWQVVHFIKHLPNSTKSAFLPTFGVTHIETDRRKIHVSANFHLLKQSPKFNARSITRWEHEQLLDYYGYKGRQNSNPSSQITGPVMF